MRKMTSSSGHRVATVVSAGVLLVAVPGCNFFRKVGGGAAGAGRGAFEAGRTMVVKRGGVKDTFSAIMEGGRAGAAAGYNVAGRYVVRRAQQEERRLAEQRYEQSVEAAVRQSDDRAATRPTARPTTQASMQPATRPSPPPATRPSTSPASQPAATRPALTDAQRQQGRAKIDAFVTDAAQQNQSKKPGRVGIEIGRDDVESKVMLVDPLTGEADPYVYLLSAEDIEAYNSVETNYAQIDGYTVLLATQEQFENDGEGAVGAS